MKGRDRLRRTLYTRIKRADDAGLTALTVLRARAFLAVFPTFWPAWHHLGQALTDLARYDEAEQAILKAIEDFPPGKLRHPYQAMGHVFNSSGDFERAEHWFRRAIEAAPDHAAGYIYLGGSWPSGVGSPRPRRSIGGGPNVPKGASMKRSSTWGWSFEPSNASETPPSASKRRFEGTRITGRRKKPCAT